MTEPKPKTLTIANQKRRTGKTVGPANLKEVGK